MSFEESTKHPHLPCKIELPTSSFCGAVYVGYLPKNSPNPTDRYKLVPDVLFQKEF